MGRLGFSTTESARLLLLSVFGKRACARSCRDSSLQCVCLSTRALVHARQLQHVVFYVTLCVFGYFPELSCFPAHRIEKINSCQNTVRVEVRYLESVFRLQSQQRRAVAPLILQILVYSVIT